jgi:hypothetical protein
MILLCTIPCMHVGTVRYKYCTQGRRNPVPHCRQEREEVLHCIVRIAEMAWIFGGNEGHTGTVLTVVLVQYKGSSHLISVSHLLTDCTYVPSRRGGKDVPVCTSVPKSVVVLEQTRLTQHRLYFQVLPNLLVCSYSTYGMLDPNPWRK